MTTYTAVRGQSLRDVCLITYGSLDFLTKLAIDNDISDLNDVNLSGITFSYDESLVVSQTVAQSVNGFYGCAFTNVCPIVTGLAITDTSPIGFTFSWGGVAEAISYRYFITTTPDEPTGVGTVTTAKTITVGSLDQDTTYYVWVKSICDNGNESGFSVASDTTGIIPAPPILTDLVGSYYSTFGVETDGSGNATKWNDLSGNNNHLYLATANKPLFDSNVFGDKPAVVFASASDKRLITSGNFVGLSGSKECTAFIVCKCTGSTIKYLFLYGQTGSIFELLANGALTNKVNLISKTDGTDINSGTNNIVYGNNIVVTSKFNANLSAVNEQTIYVNGDNSGYANIVNHENAAAFTSEFFSIGQADCKIACILIYKAALSDSDRTLVENDLMTYFSI